MYDRINRKPGAGSPLDFALPRAYVPGRIPLGGRRPPHVNRPGAVTGVAPVTGRPAPAPVTGRPAPAPMIGQPAKAPVTGQPAQAPVTGQPAQEAPVRAQFDTPGHVGGGDSVPGESVLIRGIPFTPGELAALVDFIGNLALLEGDTFTFDQVARMHQLLEDGVEDAWAWDEATNGIYSEEAQANEKHFAPSAADGGQNFRDQFVTFFTMGLVAMGEGNKDHAKLMGYTAEHYLEDAFSAGHALPALDVARIVDTVMDSAKDRAASAEIARKVFASAKSTITQYEMHRTPIEAWHPVDEAGFSELAYAGAALKGNDGISDSVRRYIHEHLAGTGLEVVSEAHPEPFMLYGDHDLGKMKSNESVKAMQTALAETRHLLDQGAPNLAVAAATAAKHFERHRPRPTVEGQKTIEGAMQAGTGSETQIIAAVVDSMIATIGDVMSNVVALTKGWKSYFIEVRKITPEVEHPNKQPELAPYDPYQPVEGKPVTAYGEPGK